MTNHVLKIQGLSKCFNRFSLKQIDLQVEQGVVTTVVGENGSGKTTLFRMLMHMLKPDDGSIEIFGEPVSTNDTQFKQSIGYVGGVLEAFGHLSIREIAELRSFFYTNWDADRYADLLDRYQIDPRMKYSKCSTGMKKKIEFIFAIVHHPKLLILDELSAGVDIVSQRKMKEDLIQFMEDGNRSILMATHIMDEIKQLSDYICILHEGRLLRSFEKDEIHDKWARLWLSGLSAAIKSHPNVKEISETPPQLVTDDVEAIEAMLSQENITITHKQHLNIDELITYYMES